MRRSEAPARLELCADTGPAVVTILSDMDASFRFMLIIVTKLRRRV
jgi:L-arabinose isomerase